MIAENTVYDTLRYFVLINPVNLDSADLKVSLVRLFEHCFQEINREHFRIVITSFPE